MSDAVTSTTRLRLRLALPLVLVVGGTCFWVRSRAAAQCVPVGEGGSIDIVLAALVAAMMVVGLMSLAVGLRLVASRRVGVLVVAPALVAAALLFFAVTGPAGHGGTSAGCVDLVPTWWPRWLPTG